MTTLFDLDSNLEFEHDIELNKSCYTYSYNLKEKKTGIKQGVHLRDYYLLDRKYSSNNNNNKYIILASKKTVKENSIQNFLDIMLKDSRLFEVLRSLISHTELLPDLDDIGTFTFFAPTDTAFDSVQLNELKKGQLKDILRNHIVQGTWTAENLYNGTQLLTLTNNVITINNINVSTADMRAKNGILHVINNVLIPPTTAISPTSPTPPTPPPAPTLPTLAALTPAPPTSPTPPIPPPPLTPAPPTPAPPTPAPPTPGPPTLEKTFTITAYNGSLGAPYYNWTIKDDLGNNYYGISLRSILEEHNNYIVHLQFITNMVAVSHPIYIEHNNNKPTTTINNITVNELKDTKYYCYSHSNMNGNILEIITDTLPTTAPTPAYSYGYY